MRKEYEKPILEVVEFEYNVQTVTDSATGNVNVGDWWTT